MTGLKTRLNDDARRPSGERGVTLIEALLVLGIVTAFIGGALVLYDQAQESAAKREAIANIYGIIASIQNSYAGSNNIDYQGVSFASLGIPATNQVAWDADVTLTGILEVGGGPAPVGSFARFARIGVDGLSEAQCRALTVKFGEGFAVTGTLMRARDRTNGDAPYGRPFVIGVSSGPGPGGNGFSCRGNMSNNNIYIFLQ